MNSDRPDRPRIHNFSAGPAVMPESVVLEARDDLWSYGQSGMGIAEMSHRSKTFDGVVQAATARLSRLLRLDADQAVLFLHGGARSQFYMLPMNLLRGGRATYLDTGVWAGYALADARRYGTVDVPFSSAATQYDHLPEPGGWGTIPDDTVYFHYTSNNTIAGTEYHYVPEVRGTWLACDMSSNFLSRPVDGSKFDFLYAGAQKNLGPSGATVVVIRRSLLAKCNPDLPSMLRYPVQVDKGSMLNTPCTFAIYMIERMTAWIEAQGLDAVEARNIAQADRVYAAIDRTGFWKGKVRRDARSRMNLTFTTGNPELDARFVAQATAAGLAGLKGHQTVGGLRASLYNAQTDEAVDALVRFMDEFERTHG